MAKHTKRRAAEKQRRGKGSRKYGGKVKNTDGTVVSGVRGTIATELFKLGLPLIFTNHKEELVNLFKSLNGLIRTKYGKNSYKISINYQKPDQNVEISMTWEDLGNNIGAAAVSFFSGVGFQSKTESPPERVAQTLRDIYSIDGKPFPVSKVNVHPALKSDVTETTPAKDIGDLYLKVVKEGTTYLATRPAKMVVTPSGVEITKKKGETPVTLTLSEQLENDVFIGNILLLYARMED